MIPDSVLLLALNFLFASIAIATLTILVKRFVRPLPVQHAILVAGLVACLAAPIAITTGWLGNWGCLPVHQSLTANRATADSNEPSTAVTSNRRSLSDSNSSLVPNYQSISSHGQNELTQRSEIKNELVESQVNESNSAASASTIRSWSSFHVARSIGTTITLVWMIGFLFSFYKHLRSWRIARHLVNGCRQINDKRLQLLVAKRARQLGINRVPELLESSSLAFPAVTGFRTPRLIIPSNLLKIQSEPQLQMILAHELAHISRKDHRTVMLQAAASCIYWWNPLVIHASSEMSRIRELICDDIAVESCGHWQELAHSIVSIAEVAIGRPQGGPQSALQLGMSAGNLEQRVVRLLARKGEFTTTRISWMCKLALFVIVTIGVSSFAFAQVPTGSNGPGDQQSESARNIQMTVDEESGHINVTIGEELGSMDLADIELRSLFKPDKLTSLDKRVMQELTAAKETPNIVFHYRPDDLNDKKLAKVVQLNLEKFDECKKLLQMDYSGQIHIFLYRDVADLQKTTGTSAVAFSTGTVSVHQAIDFDSVHELTHIFALQFPRDEDAVTDNFTVEGLATILAKSDEQVPIHSWAAVYQSKSRIPSLVELRRSWPEGVLTGVHPYHVAGSFVGYLIEEFGIEKVKRWYVHSTEAHMEFGKTFRRLERDWLKWLEQQPVQPEHRDQVLAKLGWIAPELESANVVKLFDGESLSGWQTDDESNWKVENELLIGQVDSSWTFINTERKFPSNVGAKVKFRLVEGKAVSVRINCSIDSTNHVNLATWATYVSAYDEGGYVGLMDLKIKPGEWYEVMIANDNGTAQLYLNDIAIGEYEGIFHETKGAISVGVEEGTIEVKKFVALETAK